MPRRTSGRLRPRQSAGRYPPPQPSLTLPVAEFSHPIGGGARFSPKAPGEIEHRHRADRLLGRRRCPFLPLQPGQQLPGMRFVQLFHLLNDHVDGAHMGSVAPLGNGANSAFWEVQRVIPPPGYLPALRRSSLARRPDARCPFVRSTPGLIAKEVAAMPQSLQCEICDFARFFRHRNEDESFNGLLLSETALGREWNTPKEDAAWACL